MEAESGADEGSPAMADEAHARRNAIGIHPTTHLASHADTQSPLSDCRRKER